MYEITKKLDNYLFHRFTILFYKYIYEKAYLDDILQIKSFVI